MKKKIDHAAGIKILLHMILICLLFTCKQKPDESTIERWKQEILETEQAFTELVKEQGMHRAFVAFAAEDAVLMRNNELIIGKENIDIRYQNQDSKGLDWKPDFIHVAASGDLAYTYGHYTYTYADSTGASIENQGVFHTVWKRQANGEWKFVWD